jgi:hypothetical protein
MLAGAVVLLIARGLLARTQLSHCEAKMGQFPPSDLGKHTATEAERQAAEAQKREAGAGERLSLILGNRAGRG